MTFTNIVIGSLAWGGPVNSALSSQDARITELESAGGSSLGSLGFGATNFDPGISQAGTVLVSGTVYMIRIDLTTALTLTSVTIGVVTAGATLTAAQNLAGIYDAAGNRVAVSADQSASWVTNGEKIIPMVASYAAAAGTYYLALLSNGTTPISPLRGLSFAALTSLINHGTTAATARWTSGPTAQTTLPATITMASRTPLGNAFWGAFN